MIDGAEQATLAWQQGLQADRSKSFETEAEAGKAFEQMLLTVLVRELRETMTDGLFGQSAGSGTMAEWFDQLMADALGDANRLGLGDHIDESLRRQQTQGRAERLARDRAEKAYALVAPQQTSTGGS